ncbi:T9SS type B sorting domain-containing protein [Flavobacterium cucumis]|uniref:Gliding motility-associated C-terminal domain-containing protein n=1 Tax=Flavobacterium cucumis TaxID=416016 RepID=A0A1M7ZY04_9FLAO|nr:T9SS type B sorting domain-containing protein [Flavobacterium cucumis]SHO73736.1 gliding motility-associated C-terminal domain-containing protein [Flavobacterium cucumis]
MKKIVFFVAYFIINFAFSQGNTCATADPFCSGDQALIFPNTVGQPNSSQIACLGSQPNATWFYLQVEDPGILEFDIIQNTAFDAAGNPIGTGLDVDFVAWGPFSPNDDFCTMIDMNDCPTCPNNTSNPNFYPFGNIIDCSYSAAPVESLTINNAVANQIYAILITNFNGDPGFIKLVQTNSTAPTSGSTNCEIVCGVDLGSDQFYCSTTITSHTLTATFNQAPSIPGTPSYSWFLDGALQATTTTNSLTVNQSGVWSVEVVRPGCSDVATDSVEIRFSSEPVLNAPPSTIDIGCGPFDLTSLIPALVAPESPADFVVYFYTDQLDCWDGNANYIPNPTAFAPTVNTDIFIRVENVGNPLCNNADQFLTLIYNCNPLASISSSSSVCEGSTATVTFTSDPGNVITYTVDGGPDQTVTIDATGQYVLTTPPLSADSVYTIVSVFDGVTTTTLTGVSTTISVIALPTVTISGTADICSGTSTDLTFTGTPDATVTYTDGTTNFTTILTGGVATVTVTPTATTTYSLVDVATNTTPVCNASPAPSGSAVITVSTQVTGSLSYSPSDFCTIDGATYSPTVTITGGGTGLCPSATPFYAATPAGLSIDPVTGVITPSTSTPGTYTVTLTYPACGGCASIDFTTTVTISSPGTASVSYTTPLCTSDLATYSPTLTGAASATNYTATPAGLTIDVATGVITPSTSLPGTYTINYLPSFVGACVVTGTPTTVTITAAPTASISYAATPYCNDNATAQAVTLTGTNNYTGGVFSAVPATGLILDASTGAITPSGSTPGTYTVSYAIPANGGCTPAPVTTTVTITPLPTASISYAASPYCDDNAIAQTVTLTGTGAYTGGTYSVLPATGLILDTTTGAITPSGSTPGTYTVSYAIPASGGCTPAPVSTTVTITAAPTASISYAATPYCNDNATAQAVTLTGTNNYTGGVFSAVPATGLILDASTGAITPSGSTPGTYTVSYAIPANGGCTPAPVTTTVTITPLPTASISYAASPYCDDNASAQTVTLTGTGAYTGGTYSALPATGLILDTTTGAITPSGSTPGTYTVSYAIPASGGCTPAPVSTTVTITAAPTASISYAATPYCNDNATAQAVTLTGTNNYTGGVFSAAPATGLILDATTGAITPSGSTPGTYTVSYAIPANGGCTPAPVTTTVTITPLPTAIINYAGSPYCETITTSQAVGLTGTGAYTGGTYSALPATGLILDTTTGAITPSGSTPGTYTVSYAIPASGGCTPAPVSTTVTITSAPTASFTVESPICSGATSLITITGTPNAVVTYAIDGVTQPTVTLDNTGQLQFDSSVLTNSVVYNLVGVDLGCYTDLSAQPSQSITVLSLPTAAVSANATCEGTTGIVTFTGTPNATVSYTFDGSPVQTIFLGPSGTQNLITPVLTSNSVYTIESVSFTTGTLTCVQNIGTSATVIVNPIPDVIATPNTQTVCSGTATSINLSSSVSGTTFSWVVTSQTNVTGATNGSGAVISNVLSTVTGGNGTVEYSVTPISNGCTGAPILVQVDVTPRPTLSYTVTNSVCDGATLDFVLNSNLPNTTYNWSASVSNISGSYLTTTSGDETNINQIATLTNSENVGTISMIIVPRANGCDGIASDPIVITVNPIPVIESVTVADNSVCSATNGTNNVHVDIVGNVSGITYTWSAITNGATIVGGVTTGTVTASSTTLALDFQVVTSDPLASGTIVFEVAAVRNGCTGNILQSEVITVNPIPGTPIPLADKTICSGEGTDLMIDVSPVIAGTELVWQVLSAVNVTGAQAGTGIAPQAINDTLTSDQGGYVIYRVRTRLGDCEGGYTDYRVDVTPLPVPVIAAGNICVTASGEVFQTYTLNTGLSDTDYDFEWFDTNGTIIAGATSATLVVDEAGTYSVIATNVLTGCSSDPTLASATAVVTATIPATAMTVVQSEYFSDNATITVTVADGTGTLLYQLDEGAIQSSNVFTSVAAGPHVVKVFDAEGCTYIEESIFVIDYPKFFTPNGDGYNDTWNITGLNQTNAKLYIFDRYGKLVKELSATDASEGWDGTYNQEDLPSTDYWFTLDYDENGTKKQFKAHFSLKR